MLGQIFMKYVENSDNVCGGFGRNDGMNDTIHVSSMRGIESLLPGMRKQVSNTKSNISYKDMHVPLQTNAADVATSPENVTAKITADMTMGEYMNYIYDKKRVSAELERDRITTDASREIARANRQNSIPVALSSYDMNSVLLRMPQMGSAETITTKRFMPDGTVITTTKKDGKIVEQSKKKPHLVPVTDGLTGEVKLEPYQSIFELI